MTDDDRRLAKNARAREAYARRTKDQQAAKIASKRRRRSDPEKKARDLAAQRAIRRAWSPEQRAHKNKMAREWRANKMTDDQRQRNREYMRRYGLMRKFGITPEQWDAMFDQQGRCCALCSASDPGSAIGWSTDHDHVTGAVRGVLCHPCNVRIGQMGDNAADVVAHANAILEYLRRPCPIDRAL